MKEQDAQDRHDESVAMKLYWEKEHAAGKHGTEQDAKDRADESEAMKAFWEKLKADAAAGDPTAVAKLAEIRERGSKEGWAKKKAEEGK